MSLNPRYKLVLRPEFPTIDGVRSLNGLPIQPLVDTSGNIDMSGNYLLVKNIEAGTESFTTNGEIGIINVFSDSTTNGVSCINFNHDRNNIGGNNRRYCSFQPRNTNFIAGSITGNPATVSYNTTSDERAKNLVIDTSTTDNNKLRLNRENNGAYNSYMLRDGGAEETNYTSWLDSVNTLCPLIYQFKSEVTTDTSFNFDISLNDIIETKSVNYQGFFADDVRYVYPPAVTGMPNEVDSSGAPVYQQLDMSKLVPMLVGAIKDLTNKVTALEHPGLVNKQVTREIIFDESTLVFYQADSEANFFRILFNNITNITDDYKKELNDMSGDNIILTYMKNNLVQYTYSGLKATTTPVVYMEGDEQGFTFLKTPLLTVVHGNGIELQGYSNNFTPTNIVTTHSPNQWYMTIS